MKKAVILLSGGLDSATCLALAKHAGFMLYTLSFDYGQKQHSELHAAERIAHAYGATHRVMQLQDLGNLGGSALTDASITIPDYQKSDAIPATYVPARNTIFLSVALGFAEINDARDIFIGSSAIDFSGYPDCRPDYFKAYQAMATLATRCGVSNDPIRINTPLLYLSKAQTIQKGLALGVDYRLTVSCYRADEQGLACGRCDSCMLRQKGFREAGSADPTRYQENT